MSMTWRTTSASPYWRHHSAAYSQGLPDIARRVIEMHVNRRFSSEMESYDVPIDIWRSPPVPSRLGAAPVCPCRPGPERGPSPRVMAYRCSPRHLPPSVLSGALRVVHHIVHRCPPHHPPHSVSVLATSSTTWCTGARHITRHKVYRCSPHDPPHSVLPGALHVIHHIVYRCSPHRPPHSVPVFATSSTT